MQYTWLCQHFAQIKKSSVTNSSKGKQVKTVNGIVEGVMEKSGIYSYKRVPFAAPPVGDLRWKEPQPANNWNGVLKADRFGYRPMQTAVFGDMSFRSPNINEDCLYLNIWTPSKNTGKLLPMVQEYRHGRQLTAAAMVPLCV